MPTKALTKTQKSIAAAKPLRPIPKELIDKFVTGPMSGAAANAASVGCNRALIERAMGAELSHHLGYSPGAVKPESTNNHRNGSTGKTVRADDGPLRTEVPRDRHGSFEPASNQTHLRHEERRSSAVLAAWNAGLRSSFGRAASAALA